MESLIGTLESATDVRVPNIAVCILTRMRESGLARALEGVAKQKVNCSTLSRLRVIVVDNDSNRSGQQVCDRLRPSYPWLLEYVVEPAIGIPQARNRALDMTLAEDDLIVFLDDDEVPCECWLDELLRVWRDYSADVVFGPVRPYFPEQVPPWIERGRLFDRKDHPTGTVCSEGGTGNVLISVRMLRQSGFRFDETYRLSGGSDTFFFRKAHQSGYRMIWSKQAVAVEWVPKSRASLKWLVTRHFRNGVLQGKVPSFVERIRICAVGIARIMVGTCCALATLPLGMHRAAKVIRWTSFGVGLLYGAAGWRFDEYRTIHSA